jgi:hypothetical protein
MSTSHNYLSLISFRLPLLPEIQMDTKKISNKGHKYNSYEKTKDNTFSWSEDIFVDNIFRVRTIYFCLFFSYPSYH